MKRAIIAVTGMVFLMAASVNVGEIRQYVQQGSQVSLTDEEVPAGVVEEIYFIEDTQSIPLLAETASIPEDGIKTHFVQLPPDYHSSARRYPVIYLLHGFTKSPEAYESSMSEAFQRMMAGDLEQVILVAVDHTNAQIGSYMRNSPVTGHWETAFLTEIIPYIDSRYRTIPTGDYRALFGHSMGGFAALHFGMEHPHLFNGVYGFAPNIIVDEDLEGFVGGNLMLNKPIGSALAPNPGKKYPYDIPAFDGSEGDSEVIEKWLDGLGHIDKRVDAYLKEEGQLAIIGIEVGTRDAYTHFIPGCEGLARVLEDRGIPHEFYLTDGLHGISVETVCDRALPLLIEYFPDDQQ